MTEPRTMDAKGLRELLEKATPGRLHAEEVDGHWCVVREQGTPGGSGFAVDGECWKQEHAALIAEAVNALPALLSELDRLRGEVAGLPAEPTPEMQAAHTMYGDTSDWWPTLLAAIKESANGQG